MNNTLISRFWDGKIHSLNLVKKWGVSLTTPTSTIDESNSLANLCEDLRTFIQSKLEIPFSRPRTILDNKCAHCNELLFFSNYVVALGRKWHPLHLLCHLCRQPVIDYSSKNRQFLSNVWDQVCCVKHQDNIVICFSCERFINPGETMFEFDEKHFFCDMCQKTAVNSFEELQAMWFQMIDFFGLSGDFREISLDFTSLEDIKQIYKEEVSEGQMDDHVLGLTLSQQSTQSVSEVIIVKGLPFLYAGSVLAHELGHCYLVKRGYPFPVEASKLGEGLCELFSYIWLMKICSWKKMQQTGDSDPLYTKFVKEKSNWLDSFQIQDVNFHLKKKEDDSHKVYGDSLKNAYLCISKGWPIPELCSFVSRNNSFPTMEFKEYSHMHFAKSLVRRTVSSSLFSPVVSISQHYLKRITRAYNHYRNRYHDIHAKVRQQLDFVQNPDPEFTTICVKYKEVERLIFFKKSSVTQRKLKSMVVERFQDVLNGAQVRAMFYLTEEGMMYITSTNDILNLKRNCTIELLVH